MAIWFFVGLIFGVKTHPTTSSDVLHFIYIASTVNMSYNATRVFMPLNELPNKIHFALDLLKLI